jgi:guanine deaminase
MTQDSFITILIAEDNDVSRDMMSSILRTQGYKVYGAIDGESAIKVIQERDVDLALVDINMAPTGGFEFVKYLVVRGIDLPVVVITGDNSSDMLLEASSLGVVRVIQKPIRPDMLLQTVTRILKKRGLNPTPLAVQGHSAAHPPEQLMARAIELADKNAAQQRGRPFGAIVADARGKILGEGVNGKNSRIDPTAHAEVMAIRQAAERLQDGDLSECVLYCSSEPTLIGQALILSVGIKKVYYGLNHDELREISGTKPADQQKPEYIQIGQEEARTMMQKWQAQKA